MGILKKSRAIEGAKQWEMAERIGKSIATVSAYENNESRVPMSIYRRWYAQLHEDAAKRYFLEELMQSFI